MVQKIQAQQTDIAVIGGGSAGICAAIAAARKGASVILIERSNQLGGMGTNAKVHTFCGLYHPDTTLPPQIANPGLPEEIESQMRSKTGVEPMKMGKVYVLPQHPEIYAKIAEELVAAEPSLTVFYETLCTGITRHEDDTFTVSTDKNNIHCRALIDTSADAVAAEFLGATRYSTSPEITQRSAFIFSLTNVHPAASEENFRMRLALEIVRAVKTEELPPLAMGTTSRASTKAGEVFFTTDLDPAPTQDLADQGESFAKVLTIFLRRKFSEYAEAQGPNLPAEPGVRETHRWKGQYTLTAEDLIEGTSFEDTVAYATWPIELRETTRGPKLTYFKHPSPAQIPLRCLRSAEIENVFFAGRCISATHEALASVRVMGTCFATGQAAGIAAAEKIH